MGKESRAAAIWIFGALLTIGATVVGMIFHSLPLVVAYPLLGVIGIGLIASGAVALWPEKKPKPGPVYKPDTPFGDAVAYASTGQWEKSFGDVWMEMGEAIPGAKSDDLHQLALNGEITVWGRNDAIYPLAVHPYEPISVEHWRTHHLDWLRLCRGDTATVAIVRDGSGPTYRDLMVSRSQVEASLAAPAHPRSSLQSQPA
ncbi:MAG: hypothetical protein JWO72_465 [Caulobacteraceae bacterium]|nr:hypothetical protein [Caulobacteraceae bacterium]